MAISKRFIGANQVDGSKIKLANNQSFRATNAAGSAVDLFKVDGSDKLVFSKVPEFGSDPVNANELARKAYVDAEVAGVQGEVDAVEGRMDSAESAISTLNGNSSVSGSVDFKVAAAIDGILNGVDGAYDTLKEIADYIAGDAAAGASMLSQLGDHESRLDTLEGQNLDSRLSTAEGEIDTLQSDLIAVENQADLTETNLMLLDGRVTTAESDIDSLEGRMSTAEGEIAGQGTRLTDAEADIVTLNNFMDDAGPRLTAAEGDIDSLETRMNAVEGDVGILQSSMATAEGAIDAVEARLDTAESDIDALQSDVAALQGSSEQHERIVLTSQMISNGYIDLAQSPKAGTTPKLLVYPDRLWLVPTDDFTRVNARITWNVASVGPSGEEALVAGDIVHVWYVV